MFFRHFQRYTKRFFSTSSNTNGKNGNLWEKYNYHLVENPIVTKSVTAGIIAFIADIVCQTYFPSPEDAKKPNERMNWRRTLNFTFLNGVIVSPIMHYWYGFLSVRIVGTNLLAAVKRVAIDQSLFAPTIIPVFLGGSLLLDGKADQIVDKLKNDWVDTVLSNYKLWIPAQLINFSVVPPPFRVLWANFIGFFWNIYLSKVANNQIVESVETNKEEGQEEKK